MLFRSVIQCLLVAVFCITNVAIAHAYFLDVDENDWFAYAALEAHYGSRNSRIDPETIAFRPQEPATRADLLDVIFIEGSDVMFMQSSFADIDVNAEYFLDFEKAGINGVITGDGNCYGETGCKARPLDTLNRAEAAAIIARAYRLVQHNRAEVFSDVDTAAWYADVIQIVADHCILQGDDGQTTVRPDALVTRAEMAMMALRTSTEHLMACEKKFRSTQNEEETREKEGVHTIDELSTPWKVKQVITAKKAVSLFRFDLSAHPVQDIVVRRLTFEAVQGSLLNAYNYTLWADADLDGVVETPLQTGVSSKGDVVVFDELINGGFVISDQTVTFEVHGSISGSPTSTVLQLQFAQTQDAIEAEEVDDGEAVSGISRDGNCTDPVVCRVSLDTTPAKTITILEQGNLFVSESPTSARSRQVLGGSLSDTLLRLRFRAQEESIDVTALQITSRGSTAKSVDRLELYTDGANKPFAEATLGACGSDDVLVKDPQDGSDVRTFCAVMRSQQLIIPEDQRVDVHVKARIKTDSEGGVAGEVLQFWLTGEAVADDVTGSGAIRARGISSQSTLVANDGDATGEGEIFIGRDSVGANADIVGKQHDVVMAKVIDIMGISFSDDFVGGGNRALANFVFETVGNANSDNGTNAVTLEGIIFSLSVTNALIDSSSFQIYSTLDTDKMQTCSALDTSGGGLSGDINGAFLVQCSGLSASNVATMASPGTDVDLVLQANVTNPIVDAGIDASIHVSLHDFNSRSIAAGGFGATNSHIHWKDEDGATSNDVFWIEFDQTEVRAE